MTAVRSFSSALAAASVLAGAGAAQAQLSGRFYGDVTARAGYASNPFLQPGDDTGSFYGEVLFTPSYTLSDALSTTEIAANLRFTDYFEGYNSTESYGLTARHQHKIDELTDGSLSINFDSSVLGEQEILLGVPGEPNIPDPTDPNAPGTPGEVPDIDLFGTAQRQSVLGVEGSLNRRLSALDSIRLQTGASRTWYESPLANDFRSYDASVAYTRTISDRATAGLSVSANWTDYDNVNGDAAIYSPRLTFTRRFSSSLSLDASLGAQFIEKKGPGGDSTGFSGSLSLCRSNLRSSLCLTASREAGASGAGSIREQTSASLSYSYRLAEYDSLRANVSYGKSGSSGTDPGSEYLNSDVSWERRINQRLLGGVNVAYRNIYGTSQSTSGDVNAQVFLRVSLGQLR